MLVAHFAKAWSGWKSQSCPRSCTLQTFASSVLSEVCLDVLLF